MRVSLSWLKDFVDIREDIEKVQSSLTMTGLEVTSILDMEEDHVMDIEVTPNRPDCLSVLGVARELAVAMGKTLDIPASIKKNYMKNGLARGAARIEIIDKKGCPRYVGCIIKNARIGPSSKMLVDRLNAMGVRSINNIVDITNYVLFESGQPLHAFDLDKLEGRRIVVRKAKRGEDIVTIDGVKRELEPSMLVIADAKKPVAIAGIMGGRDTEISSETKNILLESAYFDPITIRKTQRKLGLASESSYRFERGVDFAMVLAASVRAQELIRDMAKGRVAGRITDVGPKIKKAKEIVLSLDDIPRVLGIEIDSKKVMDYLNRLKLVPVKKGKGEISVKVPSYRQDLDKGIDLIEEVTRIYGYDKIPVKLPSFTIQKTYEEERKNSTFLQKKAREILHLLGMNEIVTYTLTSRFAIEAIGRPFDNIARLRNPLSANQEFMRPSLLSEMLEVLSWNINRKNNLLKLFELNKVYFRDEKSQEIQEKVNLAVGMCGTITGNWKEKARDIDFFDLKGMLESFLTSWGIKDYIIEATDSFIFKDKMSIGIKIDGKTVGVLGEVKPEVARKFDIKQKVYLAELSLEDLMQYVDLQKRFKSLPRYPSAKRDISLVVDDTITASRIFGVIKEVGKDLVRSINVFDLYKGQQIDQSKKSLAYTLEYRSDERTLKDEEVNEIHKNILEALVKQFGAQIR